MTTSVKTHWVKIKGVNTHYLSAGQHGSTVLLLHAAGFDSAGLAWQQSIEPMSKHHRVFALDWPGNGISDTPDIKYTTDYYVKFLTDFMDYLKIDKTSLVGLSLGGAAALGFTLQAPKRVSKLILVDSYGLGGEIPLGIIGYLISQLPLVTELAWFLQSHSRTLLRFAFQQIVYNPKVITNQIVDHIYEEAIRRAGVMKAFRSFQKNEVLWPSLRTNYVNRLHKINVPTLILHGENDNVFPQAWAKRAHRLIPNSKLKLFPHCRHWLPKEKPKQFNKAILEFLDTKVKI